MRARLQLCVYHHECVFICIIARCYDQCQQIPMDFMPFLSGSVKYYRFLFVFYLVFSLVSAIHHKAHLSLMTHDPFLLSVLKKVMDLNFVVKETFHFPNLQIVRPQGNLTTWLMINHSNEMRVGSKMVKNGKIQNNMGLTLFGRVCHICCLFLKQSLLLPASSFFLDKELARFLY